MNQSSLMSKSVRCVCALGFIVSGLVAASVHADAERFEITGTARVRSEFRNNSDFSNAAGDYTDSIGSRFRLDMKFKPNDKVNVFFQPQFSKSWGAVEFVPTAAGVNTPTNSSGALHDTPLDVHQAFIGYAVDDSLSFSIGRKELNYGDQLLVGAVGWSNVGRSFDLLQGSYKYAIGSVEAFSAAVKDTNVSASAAGERSLSGVYSSNHIADYMQNLDAYVLSSIDRSVSPKTSTAAYGVRVKSPVSVFDYRAEVTFENVKGATSTDENQVDAELGYTVHAGTKTRIGLEVFSATKNFDQLYPTGHKWLGYADLFSRRNLKGARLGVSTALSDKLSLSLDLHRFQRNDTSLPAYKFSGAAYGAAGTDAALASEADLVVGYKLAGDLALEAGASRVNSGEYLKVNGGPDAASFYYLQAATSF